MNNPVNCIYWRRPKLLLRGGMRGNFDIVETYVESSHLYRRLVKCKECGHLYFYEFYETIDWIDGEDPQYITYIPVETDEEIEQVKNTTDPLGLLQFFPRLQLDYPKGAKKRTAKWARNS